MALPLKWPQSKPFQPPTSVIEANPNEWPVPKLHSTSHPSDEAIMQGISSDGEFDAFLAGNKGKSMSLVQFGSLHCLKCHEFFPDFLSLAKKYDRMMKVGVAQVEWLKVRAEGIKYSPTFNLYSKQGRLVDQVLGKDKQKLEDHMWLWQED